MIYLKYKTLPVDVQLTTTLEPRISAVDVIS